MNGNDITMHDMNPGQEMTREELQQYIQTLMDVGITHKPPQAILFWPVGDKYELYMIEVDAVAKGAFNDIIGQKN